MEMAEQCIRVCLHPNVQTSSLGGKSAIALGCPNLQFIQYTRALRWSSCRHSDNLLRVQTSLEFTDLITHKSLLYGCCRNYYKCLR